MRLLDRAWLWKASTVLLALALVTGCGKEKSPPTATAVPTPTQRQGGIPPTSTVVPRGPTPTAAATLSSTPTGSQVPPPAAAPLLRILAPTDGSVIAGTSTTIRGQSIPEATVLINGDLVDLAQDGSFSLDVPLDEGPNIFEIIAIGEKDEVITELTITGSSEAAAGQAGTSNQSAPMSITVTDPEDGSVVNTDTVTITGRTTPGAVVLVGDQAVDVDANGGFSVTVGLEQGANVFVITSADDSNLAETELSVFYEP